MNILIIGNSGSGKSTLATKLSDKLNQPTIHLDKIFWMDGHFNRKRPDPELCALTETSNYHHGWIAEGVYGDLAIALLDQVDIFIWLDLPWDVCKIRLLERSKSSPQTEEQTNSLIEWAANYQSRSDQFSHEYHEQIYLDFPREKFHLRDEQEVNALKLF